MEKEKVGEFILQSGNLVFGMLLVLVILVMFPSVITIWVILIVSIGWTAITGIFYLEYSGKISIGIIDDKV